MKSFPYTQLRTRARLTLAEVADKLNISIDKYDMLEYTRELPKSMHIFCKIYSCSEEYLQKVVDEESFEREALMKSVLMKPKSDRKKRK